MQKPALTYAKIAHTDKSHFYMADDIYMIYVELPGFGMLKWCKLRKSLELCDDIKAEFLCQHSKMLPGAEPVHLPNF